MVDFSTRLPTHWLEHPESVPDTIFSSINKGFIQSLGIPFRLNPARFVLTNRH
jgi:hypothetical protein